MNRIGYARAIKVIDSAGATLIRQFDGYREYRLRDQAMLSEIAIKLTLDPCRKNPSRAYNCHWERNSYIPGSYFFSIQKSR